MIRLKAILIFLLLQQSVAAPAQETAIIKLLNEELKNHLAHQAESPIFEGDTIILVQPYTIQQKVLSIELKSRDRNSGEYVFEKQEVPLGKLINILKDINIIFTAAGNEVKKTRRYKNDAGEMVTETNFSALFFTGLNVFPNNEYIADNMVKAFAKAGYKIKKDIWAD